MMESWRQPDLPKTGWHLTYRRDMGRDPRKCPRCGGQRNRWQCCMSNDHVRGGLECCGICAAELENIGEDGEPRDKELATRITRRHEWLSQEWLISQHRNPYVVVDGIGVAIFRRGTKWGYSVAQEFGAETYRTRDDAKWAALDALERYLFQLEAEFLVQPRPTDEQLDAFLNGE